MKIDPNFRPMTDPELAHLDRVIEAPVTAVIGSHQRVRELIETATKMRQQILHMARAMAMVGDQLSECKAQLEPINRPGSVGSWLEDVDGNRDYLNLDTLEPSVADEVDMLLAQALGVSDVEEPDTRSPTRTGQSTGEV